MKRSILLILSTLMFLNVLAQEQKNLTLEEVIQLAKEQSLDAIIAKHRFRASYWEYRTHIASFRPSVGLSTSFPDFNRSIKKYQREDGSYTYVEDFVNSTDVNINVNQNIGFTGGQLFINSGLQRLDGFGDNEYTSYMSSPVQIGYRQPVLFYNEYKWSKKIEPLKYKEAEKEYLSSMENVSIKAVGYFFDLALAQINLQVSEINYSNADTLYKIAQGRYQIGTIAENELMQMELSFLNAGSSLNSAVVDLEIRKARLRSFLGFNENVDLKLFVPKEIPTLDIDVQEALEMAKQNNPEVIAFERQLIEAEQTVAQAKAEKGVQANLFASFGLTQQAENFSDVYNSPQDQESFRLGLEIPIIDWGLGKGKYKMAQSSQEVIRTSVDQARVDFDQNIFLTIMQFNLQDDQLLITAKADTISQRRYEVTKQRFLIGKVDVLDLNVALSEKDVAKRNYITALRNYWRDYYTIRRLTLYDFLEEKEITQDFDDLL